MLLRHGAMIYAYAPALPVARYYFRQYRCHIYDAYTLRYFRVYAIIVYAAASKGATLQRAIYATPCFRFSPLFMLPLMLITPPYVADAAFAADDDYAASAPFLSILLMFFAAAAIAAAAYCCFSLRLLLSPCCHILQRATHRHTPRRHFAS